MRRPNVHAQIWRLRIEKTHFSGCKSRQHVRPCEASRPASFVAKKMWRACGVHPRKKTSLASYLFLLRRLAGVRPSAAARNVSLKWYAVPRYSSVPRRSITAWMEAPNKVKESWAPIPCKRVLPLPTCRPVLFANSIWPKAVTFLPGQPQDNLKPSLNRH